MGKITIIELVKEIESCRPGGKSNRRVLHDDFVRRLKANNLSEYRMTDSKELKGAWKLIQILKSISTVFERSASGIGTKLAKEKLKDEGG